MAGGLFPNQVMLTSLRRHQGLVLDHCKNEHRHRYTNTKKYLDHCTCNEHEEKNFLGLHCAVDRLLLTDHHIQLDLQNKRSENGLLPFGGNYISNYLWHQRALSLLLSFLRTSPHSTHFTASLSILPLRWNCNVN